MDRKVFDVAVVGLGAMGSAVLWHLARRRIRAVGLDRFAPPHHAGSSHGQSRVIRAAYHEHPLYVPLVLRSAALWEELAAATQQRLLVRTGGLILGHPDSPLVQGAAHSAALHGLPHERWSAADVRAHTPQFRIPDGVAAVWEPGAGMLPPERCVAAMLGEARRLGARTVIDTTVIGWEVRGGVVTVATAAHDYRARSLVLTAGPWLPELLTDLPLPLTRERVVQCWFSPSDRPRFAPGRFPLFLVDQGTRMLYGLPDAGDGVKAAFHHAGSTVTMSGIRRTVTDEETREVREALAAWVPEAAGPLREATVCVYTNTPDQHFVIDRHPAAPEVLIASCCSGHGFKFAAVVGEIVADLATGAAPAFDLEPFRIGRFAA